MAGAVVEIEPGRPQELTREGVELGTLRRLKARRPDLLIGVMGCMAQLQPGAIQARAPHVDLVFGSPAIARVSDLLARARAERRPVLETGEGPLVKITAKPDGN